MALKSFSETISFDEPYPGGKGMDPGDRAKNIDSKPETGKVMGDGSEVKEFWDEVSRVSLKLGVEPDRVVMAVSGKQKGLEYSGSVEDVKICEEFNSKVMVEQSMVGSILRRGYSGYGGR